MQIDVVYCSLVIAPKANTMKTYGQRETYLLAPGHERVVALVQYIVKTERYQEVQTSEARMKSGRCEWRDILSNSNKGIYGQM
jgi:hypothetical protein